MYRQIRTVVAAVAEERLGFRMNSLLAAAGLVLERVVEDGHSAIDAVTYLRPDLLIADQLLPGLNGDALMRALERARPPVLPDRVLLCRREFMLPDRRVPEGVLRIDLPVTDEMFRKSIDGLRRAMPYIGDAMMARAAELHRYMGFPEHVGTKCLELAAALCATDERRRNGSLAVLEAIIAEHLRINVSAADRAMRHAIDAAWRSDRVEEQYRVFGDTIDAGRGRPTCREMIARIADILRLEG